MNRLANYVIIACTVAIVAVLLWYFRDIVYYLCIALVLSLVGTPLVHRLNQIKIGRWQFPAWLSATIALLVIAIVILGLITLAIPLVVSQINHFENTDFSQIGSTLIEPVERLQELAEMYIPYDIDIRASLAHLGERFVSMAFFTEIFSQTANWLVYWGVLLFSVFFIAFFFLKDEDMFNRILASFFPERYESNVKSAMGRTTRLLRRYFVGLLIQSFIIAVLTTIGLVILGIPFDTSAVCGVMAGLFNVIPYVGGFIALGFALILPTLMYLGGGAPMPLDLLLIWITAEYMIIRFIDNFFLQPLIYSSSANAHPLEIFVVLLMAAQLGGMVGMLIGVPVYIVIRVFAKEFLGDWNLVKQLTKGM